MSLPELRQPATQFIESVIALKPAIAVFDCDGTLWSGDAGADFFYWEIERGLVGREIIEAFLRAPADATARDVEHGYQQHIQYVPVEDARVAANVDTPEDYERLFGSDLISSEKQF